MNTPLLRAAAIGAICVLSSLAARADDDEHGRGATRTPPLPAYQAECSACHVAFPPGLLPTVSWQRLMANLPRHFGTDASLDAATAKSIDAWLQAHAADTARSRRTATAPPPEDRITRSAWFVREHREVTPAAWTRASVKSPANCAACHTRADQGDFSERSVRIPR